jgi:choline kinase
MLVGAHHVGWVDITGLPWTEIDFAEDLRRAETDVLPHVLRLDGA